MKPTHFVWRLIGYAAFAAFFVWFSITSEGPRRYAAGCMIVLVAVHVIDELRTRRRISRTTRCGNRPDS